MIEHPRIRLCGQSPVRFPKFAYGLMQYREVPAEYFEHLHLVNLNRTYPLNALARNGVPIWHSSSGAYESYLTFLLVLFKVKAYGLYQPKIQDARLNASGHPIII